MHEGIDGRGWEVKIATPLVESVRDSLACHRELWMQLGRGPAYPVPLTRHPQLPGTMTEGRCAAPFVRSFVACHTEWASVMRQRAWPLDRPLDGVALSAEKETSSTDERAGEMMIRSVSSTGHVIKQLLYSVIISCRPGHGYRGVASCSIDVPPYYSPSPGRLVPGNWWPHHADMDISWIDTGQISLNYAQRHHACKTN